MTTGVDVLCAARARVERGWCQGMLAVDAKGGLVHPDDEAAARWCARGAIPEAHPSELSWVITLLRTAADCLAPNESIVAWNDAPERTQADVLAAFDRAIALAQQERAS